MIDLTAKNIFIGTAAWTVPPLYQEAFPQTGTHLERYSQVLNAVEINSSFYREHKPETYAKWAQATPKHFRFSVKLSKYFTHEKKLTEVGDRMQMVLEGISALGPKWGSLLVQLPPSLQFHSKTLQDFLSGLRKFYSGEVIWEPRHLTWRSEEAVGILENFVVQKVLADPEPVLLSKILRPRVEKIRYYRLHGTPEIYKSLYSQVALNRLVYAIQHPLSPAKQTWVIFDNTTYGFATQNALELSEVLSSQ